MDLKLLKKDQLIELVNALNALNESNKYQSQNDTIIGMNETVIIHNLLNQDVGFSLGVNEEVIIEQKGMHSVTLETCNKILNKPYHKELFTNGLLYFDNSKWYKYFGISKPTIPNDEYITNILKSNNVIEQLEMLTNKRTNLTMLHYLSFKISELAQKNQSLVSFKILPQLNDYFSTQFVRVDLTRLHNAI